MPAAPVAVLLRGWLAAGFATFVALGAHVVAGDPAPGVFGVVVPLLLSAVACVLLASVRRSLVRLTASVIVSQVLFHVVFAFFGASVGTGRTAGGVPATAGTGSTGWIHGAHGGAAVAPGTFGTADATGTVLPDAALHGAGHSAAHLSPGMVVAHLAAAVLTIAVLYRAEELARTLHAVARRVARAVLPLGAPLGGTVLTGPRTTVLVAAAPVRHPAVTCRGTLTRRGPPRPLALV